MPETDTGPQGAGRCSMAGGRSSSSQPRTCLRSARRCVGVLGPLPAVAATFHVEPARGQPGGEVRPVLQRLAVPDGELRSQVRQLERGVRRRRGAASTYGASFDPPGAGDRPPVLPPLGGRVPHAWRLVGDDDVEPRAVARCTAATLPSRSQVVTHQRSSPSPKPAIERDQCADGDGRGPVGDDQHPRDVALLGDRLDPRIGVPVLPTPGSSPSRKTRPPAAARSAIASAASNWICRGSSSSVASGSGAGSSGLRVFSRNRPSV